ncbi:MAG TPA: hypothetical protein PLS12_08575, partial [Bacteroidales bacterium]|nr:hypothetical protein [Bacteroidales bacterium]
MKTGVFFRSICLVACVVFLSLFSNAQPFTLDATTNNLSNLSTVTTCGSNYTFYFDQNEYNKGNVILRDNGTVVGSASGWTAGSGTAFQCYAPCIIEHNTIYSVVTRIYFTINASTKTITASTTAPSCGTPAVALATNTVSAANIAQGSTNNVVRSFTLTTT